MIKKDYAILIVEDEHTVRQNIVEYLNLSYQHIYEAANGMEAYEIYQKKHLDLIITDINMPHMDGLTLIENIRSEDSQIPIIVVSAYSDQDKLFRAVKLKLVDYIIKPMSRKTLLTLIDKVNMLEKNKEEQLNYIILGDDFIFESSYKVLLHKNETVFLTPQEVALLEILVLNKNRVMSSVDIFYALYNSFDIEYSNGLVRNLVFKLRKILPKEMIKNFYGGGYMLCTEG